MSNKNFMKSFSKDAGKLAVAAAERAAGFAAANLVNDKLKLPGSLPAMAKPALFFLGGLALESFGKDTHTKALAQGMQTFGTLALAGELSPTVKGYTGLKGMPDQSFGAAPKIDWNKLALEAAMVREQEAPYKAIQPGYEEISGVGSVYSPQWEDVADGVSGIAISDPEDVIASLI